ncbi:hypothetical protein BDZ88DRAFT_410714 [Geranomyces variabilis]|nr:hypothetical protein BDZ88DRAFT_410714 [Geranomyces variabilis]
MHGIYMSVVVVVLLCVGVWCCSLILRPICFFTQREAKRGWCSKMAGESPSYWSGGCCRRGPPLQPRAFHTRRRRPGRARLISEAQSRRRRATTQTTKTTQTKRWRRRMRWRKYRVSGGRRRGCSPGQASGMRLTCRRAQTPRGGPRRRRSELVVVRWL